MTVATKDGFASPRRALGGKGAWRRLWQVPLLVGGLIGFGLGVRTLVQSIRPVPFDRQIHGVEGLIAQANDAADDVTAKQKYAEAIAQINILAPYYAQPAQQAELQKLAGDVIFLAQRRAQAPVPANYKQATEHYEKAVSLGLVPTVEMNERWGECALALGDAKLAVEKFDAAMAGAGGVGGAGNSSEILNRHARDLVAAYMDAGKPDKALAIVTRMLAESKAPEAVEVAKIEQLTWGWCKRIEIALGSGDMPAVDQAVAGAREALPTLHEKDPGGRVLVWIGRAELEKGQVAEAERDLAEARARFAVHHLDDGRAAVLLGRILEARGDLAGAAKLFEEVVVGQAGTGIWASARLGRADVAVRHGTLSGEQLLGDYRFAMAAVMEPHPVGKRPEMMSKTGVQASLLLAYQRAVETDKLDDALVFLALQAQTQEHPEAETILRQATTKERRGQELLAEGEKLAGAKRAESLAAGRAMLADAAEDYLKHGELTTLNDDVSGNSKWKAAFLLDAAGETDRAIVVFERLTIQRPHDARVAEGMLALGRLYESAGLTDKAVTIYERNIKENPTTPAGYTSVVNVARCYAKLAERATKPEEKKARLDKAEKLLLGLLQDNPNLEPTAREFHESLLALGQLYYDSQRWGDAILRLDEVIARYPADAAVPRLTFMLGESFRKSAEEIAAVLANGAAIEHRAELEKARAERLLIAAGYFTRVIGVLDIEANSPVLLAGAGRKLSAQEEQYLRASYMDRAECLFQRHDYEQAIKLYDETSARFSDETLAVEAYVQIVNAYQRMSQPAQATAAAERGQWILQRVPDAAFGADAAGSRGYYKKLLTLK